LVEDLNLGGATPGTEAPYEPTYGEFRGAFGIVVRKSARPYRDKRFRLRGGGAGEVNPLSPLFSEGEGGVDWPKPPK
tara:strand:+ start:1358 stop:1588 length:231 start_codon:yes stop_codon:yes gene_type:complete